MLSNAEALDLAVEVRDLFGNPVKVIQKDGQNVVRMVDGRQTIDFTDLETMIGEVESD